MAKRYYSSSSGSNDIIPPEKPRPKPEPKLPQNKTEDEENEKNDLNETRLKNGLPIGVWIGIFVTLLVALVIVAVLFINTWKKNNDIRNSNMTDEEIEQMDQDPEEDDMSLDLTQPDPTETPEIVIPSELPEDQNDDQTAIIDDGQSGMDDGAYYMTPSPEDQMKPQMPVVTPELTQEPTTTPAPKKRPEKTPKPERKKDSEDGSEKDTPDTQNVTKADIPGYKRVYAGTFLIYAYCPCNICSGSYGEETSIGTKCKAGITVASRGIPLRTKIYIPGIGQRTVEDTGEPNKEIINVYVNTHEEVKNFGFKKLKIYKYVEK